MSYTVLARKYRPQTFADQVGQEHVTRTLANAINTGRIAHAFLFTGVRGVGKTTSARLLAKALNCEHGPTPEPCNKCDACTQITAGVDLDVLEIDGASNNGVDDVRRLQESLPYRPTRDRFKIVIVDEVHMLSTAAFNAFLKTLEEPPAHVKFIFATTESHKIPVTIRSRCQHYSFRLIPQPVIAARVAYILQAEGIEADDEAIAIVAREAAGSMRDALTLLDQVIAFSGDKLLGRELSQKLGLADREFLFRIAQAVLSGSAREALEVIDAIAEQGVDFAHFSRQWLDLTRDLVVLKVAGERRELVELPELERQRAQALADAHDVLELERVFAGISKLIDELGKAGSPRIQLEMGAVRLATRPALRDLSELIARVAQLGNVKQAPAPARPAPSAPARPPAAPPPQNTRAVSPQQEAPSAKPNPFQRFVPPESSAGPQHVGELAPFPPSNVTPIASARAVALSPRPEEPRAPAPPAPREVMQPGPFAPKPTSRAPVRNTSSVDHAQWLAVIGELRKGDARWPAMFEHGVPSELTRESVVVSFQEGSFFGRQAGSPGGLEALRRAAHAVLGAAPTIDVRFVSELAGESVAQREAAQVDERKEGIKQRALAHPRVLEALKVFPELAKKTDVQVD
ncbi:MAG TPA: DNA polymerase III subunit gamma/tau [Polyangiales bacterium]|nr:DNA polymerase III subunit gamma/tau [Polyangiales bacterium]